MIKQYGDRINDFLEQILENALHEWGVEGEISRLNTSDQFTFLSSIVEAEGMFFSVNMAYDKQTMLKITCYGEEKTSVSSTTEFIAGALSIDSTHYAGVSLYKKGNIRDDPLCSRSS